jgi:hypothetical protein
MESAVFCGYAGSRNAGQVFFRKAVEDDSRYPGSADKDFDKQWYDQIQSNRENHNR